MLRNYAISFCEKRKNISVEDVYRSSDQSTIMKIITVINWV